MACTMLNWSGPLPGGSHGEARRRAFVLVHRLVAERAPHPLELAGVGIEHDDAVIAVAVGDEQSRWSADAPRRRPADAGSRCRHCRSLALALPICSTSLPSCVNFTSWSSPTCFRPGSARAAQLLPPTQTKPLWSIWMPCSRCGHSKPAPSPPQALMKLPALSNTRIAGAAILALLGLERARPLQHPDIVLRVDADAGGIGEPPLRRHLRPGAVDLEHRHGAGLRVHLRHLRPGCDNDQCRESGKTCWRASHRYLPSLLFVAQRFARTDAVVEVARKISRARPMPAPARAILIALHESRAAKQAPARASGGIAMTQCALRRRGGRTCDRARLRSRDRRRNHGAGLQRIQDLVSGADAAVREDERAPAQGRVRLDRSAEGPHREGRGGRPRADRRRRDRQR